MKKTTRTFASFAAAGLLMGTWLTACTQQSLPESDDRGEAGEQPKSASMWGHYRPEMEDGERASMMAFPTGEVDTSAVLLHQVMPEQVRRGEDFGYSYHVTNLTNGTLQNVVVSLDSTSNLEVRGSEPEASRSDGGMAWPLGDLGAGETKVISLTGNAGEVGSASDCVAVSYNNFLCATTAVVEPALALTKTATATVLRCDPIVIRYVVKNSGTGTTSDVMISDTLPTGLTLSDGSREIRIPVGPLGAGESKAFEVRAEANRVGTYESPASASAGDLRASAGKTTTVVTEPVLELTADCGDENQFLGRNFTHTYTVKNSGNGVAKNAVATIAMPAGSTVARASDGGTVDGGRVTWNLGAMAPGASQTFGVTFTGSEAKTYQTTATVNAACARTVSESCSNDLKGIPAILLEVVDIVDPVELGAQTTYLITVTNQGSAPDNNVRIVANLPEEASFVSASGATTSSASGRTVRFEPLPSLGVGEQAVWRVVVRADAEGDVRFELQMTSDNLTRPVSETEATFFYD